jgi:hypothetical protein
LVLVTGEAAARAKPGRDFLVDLKRAPPALLTAVTREQPRIPEICRRCEIGARLEI